MPTSSPRDRFDDVPRQRSRPGVHRAENPRMRPLPVLLWSVIAVVVLVAGGIVGFHALSQRADLFASGEEPAPSAQPVVDTSYTVLVLNGTPDPALTDAVRGQIMSAGWPESMVLATDSTTQDFETTTVYYAAEEEQTVAAAVADALGGAAVSQTDAYQNPDDPEAKEITVVIGLDRAG